MTSIVGVHRIGNYCYLAASGSVEAATDAISEEWTGAPGKGLVGFGLPPSVRPRSRVAYYAHLLHRGTSQGRDDVAFLDEHEQELFIDWVDQLVCVPKTDPERPAGPAAGHKSPRAEEPSAAGPAAGRTRHAGLYAPSRSYRGVGRDRDGPEQAEYQPPRQRAGTVMLITGHPFQTPSG